MFSKIKEIISNVLHGYEPAMVAGVVAAVAMAVQQAIAEGKVGWKALVPVAVAAAIRYFVTPEKRAEERIEAEVTTFAGAVPEEGDVGC